MAEGEKDAKSLSGEMCPFCRTKNLTLTEEEREIPYFGRVFLFSMTCNNCKYHKADLEAAEKHEAASYAFEVSSEEDLKVRVVKSSEAVVRIPHMLTWEPGEASQGFVTNIEGILRRARHAIETAKEDAESPEEAKKAKNMLKRLQRVMWGQEKLKIIIEDRTGNSAIVSPKAEKKKL